MAITVGKPYNLKELLEKAEAGDPDAMFDVAMAITIDSLDEDDPEGEIIERRIRYLKILAETPGFEHAIIALGGAYERGEGVEQNADEAIKWYEAAVKAGVPFGNECIGSIYFYGHGVPIDYEKAFHFFMKNVKHQSFCTLYPLGEMYRRGLYVEQNDKKAFHYYTEITDAEDNYKEMDDYYWRACYRAAYALHHGIGTKKDVQRADELIDIAKAQFDKLHTKTGLDISQEDIFNEWIEIKREVDDGD